MGTCMNDPRSTPPQWEWDTTSPVVHWNKSPPSTTSPTNGVGLEKTSGTDHAAWPGSTRGAVEWSATLSTTCFCLGTLSMGSRCARSGDDEIPQGWEVDSRGQERPQDPSQVSASRSSGLHRFPAWRATLEHNTWRQSVAKPDRNYGSDMVIFCGHFPDGRWEFTREEFENVPGDWYLRQIWGSLLPHAGPVMWFMSVNLCYQTRTPSVSWSPEALGTPNHPSVAGDVRELWLLRTPPDPCAQSLVVSERSSSSRYPTNASGHLRRTRPD